MVNFKEGTPLNGLRTGTLSVVTSGLDRITGVKPSAKTSQIEQYWEDISRLMGTLYVLDEKRTKLRSILFSKSEKDKEKVERGYGAINIIEKNKKERKGDPISLLVSLKASLHLIREYDEDLARIIDSIKTVRDPILGRIINILENYSPEELYMHFKSYYQWYKDALSRIDNEDVKNKVLDAFMQFLLRHSKVKKEISTVNLLQSRVAQWNQSYQDINSYIREGYSFIVTLRSFNEPVVTARAKDPHIRRLLLYYKERGLFVNILNQIERGEEQEAWQAFEAFYKRVEEVSKEVGSVFGDFTNAEILLELKKRFHESPEDWKREVRTIIQRLEKTKEQIIIDARKAFEELFTSDLEKIKHLILLNMEHLKDTLYRITRGKKKQVKKDLKSLFSTVKRKKSIFDKRIEEKRRRYEDEEGLKDDEGKTFSERRGELSYIFAALLQRQVIGEPVEEAQKSFISMGQLVSPLVTVAKILQHDSRRSIDAASRLLGFASGVRAEEESIESNAKVVKRNLVKNFDTAIRNGTVLAQRTQELIAKLQDILGFGSYKYN